MGFKVKIKSSLTIKTLIPQINREFIKNNRLQGEILDEIKDHIQSGKSPVRGKRFKQYSSGYAKIKGKRRPVDMTGKGTMLKSLDIDKSRRSFSIVFRSAIAEFHNTLGAGISRVIRRLLPTKNGERFAKGIEAKILKLAEEAASKATKKQNR